jgi:hypothetical protein
MVPKAIGGIARSAHVVCAEEVRAIVFVAHAVPLDPVPLCMRVRQGPHVQAIAHDLRMVWVVLVDLRVGLDVSPDYAV